MKRIVICLKKVFENYLKAIDGLDYADRKEIAKQNYGHFNF